MWQRMPPPEAHVIECRDETCDRLTKSCAGALASGAMN